VADGDEWDIEFYAIELVLAHRGLDVVETEFGKALGGGLYELHVRLSAEEVAKADISRIERGAGNPTESTLQRLAAILEYRLELV
jgi:hypothetical protein